MLGRRMNRNTIPYLVIGVVVGLAAVGWAIVVGYSSGSPRIAGQVISYRIASDAEVTLDYRVSKPSGDNVRCLTRALNAKHAEVARVYITVPPGTGNVRRTQRLATSERATAADIRDCRAVSKP